MTRNERIEENLGLVRACANRFRDKGVEYEELISAGTLGMIKAADRYDPTLGFRFSTYAVPVILGEIRALFREGGAVKVSRSLKDLSQKAKRISEEYQKEHGVPITVKTLAKLLGVDEYKASDALCASSPPLSLSDCTQEGGAPDIPVPSGEEELIEHLALTQAIKRLSEEEQNIVRLRYFEQNTQSKTAALLSTTQVQISRKEKKILSKLRMMLL
ncbi:MAG: sigma-70 family RNA polymerase sigma factor [Ruminococcus sp.]|nr:sigma-70 family RNA polymerase sigma factor [Ruminococcus sp.]